MRENQKSFLKSTKPYLEQITADRVKTKISEVPPWHLTPPEVDTSTSSRKRQAIWQWRERTCERRTTMHSRSTQMVQEMGRGRVGAAVYVPQRQHEEAFRLTDQVAILTAQLIAIRQVLLYLQKEKNRISSDLLWLAECLPFSPWKEGNLGTRPNLLREIIHLNHSINAAGTITRFHLIPSHVGLNEVNWNSFRTDAIPVD